ncbi:Amino acid permease [Ceratobasidium theobromae]|uniref:Amino acid permease n=1 Tax=Ceratobasidium theobromae TaxID=1582974 RepID=A0A5N5Q8S9_9AGAM|nr:Amino acid permease [Ceratobasidium theobromae]
MASTSAGAPTIDLTTGKDDSDDIVRETDETLLADDRSVRRRDWDMSRALLFLGIAAGGPFALWTSSLISCIFFIIIAAVLCEICSALPTSGSLYVWAAEAAGPKHGRFIAFISAWWVTAAWMAFPASATQFATTYLLFIPSISLYGLDFPGGISNDNVKWRAVVWVVAQALLLISIGISCAPPHRYPLIFRTSMVIILIDALVNFIWLPIGVSRTYGFRSAKETLLSTYNGTGAPPVWNWLLSFFSVISAMYGFEASAHVAEETNSAKVVAARSVFASGVSIGLCQFLSVILYLFCAPRNEVIATLHAPQPFILIYDLSIGRGGATFMAVLSTLNQIFAIVSNTMAASRLVFAVARDGVLPFASWVQDVTPDKRPRNAILLVYAYSAILQCSILPSSVAFSSLISIAGVQSSKYPLGYMSRPFYLATALFGAFAVAILVSPLQFPVTGPNLNYTGVVFGIITIIGLLSWVLIPEEKWMRSERIMAMYEAVD